MRIHPVETQAVDPREDDPRGQDSREGVLERQKSVPDLFPEVYCELRELAGKYLSSERSDHTLQPTALVHETYLRLAKYDRIEWQNQAHVVAVASYLMRQILVNHAKARRTAKRGGGRSRCPFDEALAVFSRWAFDVVELDEALRKLMEFSPRLAKVVELRFFGGLGVREVASVLGISDSTVERNWCLARAWLHRQLSS